MICRKCGITLPDNVVRCTNCGIKVNMLCPNCKTLTPFGEKYCVSCGFELIKICPSCKSSNVYSSSVCRKCGSELSKSNEESIVRPLSCHSSSNQLSQDEIVTPIHEEFETPVFETNEQSKPVFQPEVSVNDEETVVDVSNDVEIETAPVNSNEDDVQGEVVETENLPDDVSTVEQEQIDMDVAVEDSLQEKNEDEFLYDDIEIDQLEEYTDIDVQESLNENSNKEQPEQQEEVQIDYDQIEIRKEVVKTVVKKINSSIDKYIFAVHGPEGSGKSAVLKQVSNVLNQQGYVALYGNCTPLSQITSFGFFQDAFLRMMGFPPYINSSETFVKDFRKSDYVNSFAFLEAHELPSFLNLFYPAMKDKFENILENKQQLFNILEKVIKSFLVSSDLVIVIDNFELLDGASYDFINYLLSKKAINSRLKLLVAYKEDKSIQSYFDLMSVDEAIFETIKISKFTPQELLEAVDSTIYFNVEDIVPEYYLNNVIERSNGNAIKMEQEIAFLFDAKYINVEKGQIYIQEENLPSVAPKTLEELIKLRINTLPPTAKNVLFMAAIMGYRFSTNILCLSVAMPAKKAEKTLEFLKQELFIVPVDNYTCEFKNLTIWKLIYQEAKADMLFKENSQRLYHTLKPLILSSNLQKVISCTEALNKKEEFLIWQDMTYLTSKLGDTNLFIIAQKQCLKLLEEEQIPNAEKLRATIYEQIGKLLSKKSPSEAVTYLANVLDSEIKDNNLNKIVDLSGYFINSCYLTGNFFGAAEAVDAIISSASESEIEVSELNIALIKTRKLKALLSIGNSEQIINIVQEEIMPELEAALNTKQIESKSKSILVDAWILSSTILAKAFAMQGNNSVYEVLDNMKQFCAKYNYASEINDVEMELIEAFAHTSRGRISDSVEILNAITNRYKHKAMDTYLLAEWNLINVINRVYANQQEDLKADLFEIAAFTNNINEHFIKNIVKLILGSVIQNEGNTNKALAIYNEQITYFAKEKVAIGALLSWALIVKLSIKSGDIEKALNTATKALEIAQSPKINNYFFTIYFQKYIAEIYLLKNDLIAVKMYLEKAIMLAKQNELKYQLLDLYIDYGHYMEEYMNAKYTYASDYVKLTTEMYNKAVVIAKELGVPCLIEKTTKARSAFKTYCQLNSIEL